MKVLLAALSMMVASPMVSVMANNHGDHKKECACGCTDESKKTDCTCKECPVDHKKEEKK